MAVETRRMVNNTLESLEAVWHRARSGARAHTLEESTSPILSGQVQRAILCQFASTGHPEHIQSTLSQERDAGFSLLTPDEINRSLAKAELLYARSLRHSAREVTDTRRHNELIDLANKHSEKAQPLITAALENQKTLYQSSRTVFQSSTEIVMDKQAA